MLCWKFLFSNIDENNSPNFSKSLKRIQLEKQYLEQTIEIKDEYYLLYISLT